MTLSSRNKRIIAFQKKIFLLAFCYMFLPLFILHCSNNEKPIPNLPGDQDVPNSPSNLQANPVSSSEIYLSWTDNSDNETGFRIERAPDDEGSPGDYEILTTTSADTNSFNHTGLAPDTTYHYRVYAFNSAGDSSPAEASAATLKNDEPPINEDITGYGEDPSSGYTESQVHVYYLDANNGNDTTGDGTSGNPWQSILKVQDVMEAGDTIILQDGNYGYFSETSSVSRTDWITIKADIGAVPVLTGINVNYASITDSYLRFDGIDLQVDDSLTDNGISLSDLRYFELRNCTVHHQLDNKYLIGTGLTIRNSDYVLIYHNHIHSVARGFSILNAQNVTIYQNHVHRLGGGTGIQYAGNCSNLIIEKNNIYDSNHDPLDADAPDDPHGSAISIRSGDVWIKDNIFHDIGSSSGIMFYTPDAAGGEEAYMNIIIENNLLYDIHNTSILRMYNLGTNVIVRNNTIIGKVRTDTSMGCYKLNSVLSVHTIADGYDGSGLEVCNNILAGTADIPSNAMISNNIFWSFYYDEDPHNFLDTLADNIIITSGNDYPIDYFTDSFFIGIDEESDFEDGHGMILDFNLHSSSEAINFGDPDNQTSKGLASIGPDGFIQFDGIPRDANHHSAGCYEY